MTILIDLVSPVTYTAGAELGFKLTITAPEAGTYYVLGALYDSSFNYISGSLFGVLLPVGALYASNNLARTSAWELAEADVQEIDCKFIFNRTDVIIGLFLMKMAGVEPSLDDDTEVSSTMVTLISAAAAIELDISALINMVIVVGMMGMMVKLVK